LVRRKGDGGAGFDGIGHIGYFGSWFVVSLGMQVKGV